MPLSIKNILKKKLLEIDLRDKYNDVSFKEMSIEDTKEYLNKIINNCEKDYSERDRTPLNKPYIHNKSIPKYTNGDINIEAFIEKITDYPKEILSVNSKMAKSASDNTLSINIGIPALRGLVFDIEKRIFYIVNTCPGAGACANFCYARQGSYVMFPDVFVKQTRILNLLMNNPDKFEKLLFREIENLAIRYDNKTIKMRWNDAGDFFSKTYFDIALRITKKLKAEGYKVDSYAYTKMGDVVNMQDKDFIINLSNDVNPKELKKIKNLETVKNQITVPLDIFDDLLTKIKGRFAVNDNGKVIFKDGLNGINELKKRISQKYNVNINTLLTYDEFLKAPIGKEHQYNVIVMPKGDGDISAQRNDVKTSFLLIH